MALFVFTGILFLARMLKLVDLVVNKNVPAGEIALLFSYIIPRFLEIALPMALLLGIIVAFGRLSLESEIVVIRACGLSLKRLVWPVGAFAFCVFAFTLFVGLHLRPWANHQLGLGLFDIAKTRARAGLIEGAFNDFGNLTIYAEKIIDNGSRLENVLISDSRLENQQRLFIAEYGHFVSDDLVRSLTLRLYEGTIHEGKAQEYTVTRFNTNNISLDEEQLSSSEPTYQGKRSKEMFLGELNESIRELRKSNSPLDDEQQKQLRRYLVEWHKRFVLPVCCVCVSLIAMALGIQPSRGGGSWGTTINVCIGILVILVYYFLFALSIALAEEGLLVPWIVMWIPNILIGTLGIWVFQQVGSEKWAAVNQALGDTLVWVGQKLHLIDSK